MTFPWYKFLNCKYVIFEGYQLWLFCHSYKQTDIAKKHNSNTDTNTLCYEKKKKKKSSELDSIFISDFLSLNGQPHATDQSTNQEINIPNQSPT